MALSTQRVFPPKSGNDSRQYDKAREESRFPELTLRLFAPVFNTEEGWGDGTKIVVRNGMQHRVQRLYVTVPKGVTL
jgi:hypothetical protein